MYRFPQTQSFLIMALNLHSPGDLFLLAVQPKRVPKVSFQVRSYIWTYCSTHYRLVCADTMQISTAHKHTNKQKTRVSTHTHNTHTHTHTHTHIHTKRTRAHHNNYIQYVRIPGYIQYIHQAVLHCSHMSVTWMSVLHCSHMSVTWMTVLHCSHMSVTWMTVLHCSHSIFICLCVYSHGQASTTQTKSFPKRMTPQVVSSLLSKEPNFKTSTFKQRLEVKSTSSRLRTPPPSAPSPTRTSP